VLDTVYPVDLCTCPATEGWKGSSDPLRLNADSWFGRAPEQPPALTEHTLTAAGRKSKHMFPRHAFSIRKSPFGASTRNATHARRSTARQSRPARQARALQFGASSNDAHHLCHILFAASAGVL